VLNKEPLNGIAVYSDKKKYLNRKTNGQNLYREWNNKISKEALQNQTPETNIGTRKCVGQNIDWSPCLRL
jgi:hypothetical protein